LGTGARPDQRGSRVCTRCRLIPRRGSVSMGSTLRLLLPCLVAAGRRALGGRVPLAAPEAGNRTASSPATRGACISVKPVSPVGRLSEAGQPEDHDRCTSPPPPRSPKFRLGAPSPFGYARSPPGPQTRPRPDAVNPGQSAPRTAPQPALDGSAPTPPRAGSPGTGSSSDGDSPGDTRGMAAGTSTEDGAGSTSDHPPGSSPGPAASSTDDERTTAGVPQPPQCPANGVVTGASIADVGGVAAATFQIPSGSIEARSRRSSAGSRRAVRLGSRSPLVSSAPVASTGCRCGTGLPARHRADCRDGRTLASSSEGTRCPPSSRNRLPPRRPLRSRLLAVI
jgi:hypothetical protein